MRTMLLAVITLPLLQVALGASVESAVHRLEPLLKELNEEQKIDLIEAMLVREHEKKDEEKETSDAAPLPPYAEAVADLVKESLKTQEENVLKARALDNDSGPVKRLAEYLQQSPGMQIKGRTARAYLDALRSYKSQWQKKRGLGATHEDFLEEIKRQGDLGVNCQGSPNAIARQVCQSSNVRFSSNPCDCATFVDCAAPNPVVQPCAPGTLWDASLTTCNHAYLVDCNVIQTPSGGIVDVTHGPDEHFNQQEGTCYRVTVDCTGHEDAKYRFFDGTCNNLETGQTSWGGAERAMKRRLDPDYADDISNPRVSSTTTPLPNARDVSLTLTTASQIADTDLEARRSAVNSLHMMQIGQFLDHDVTHTPAHDENVPCDCSVDFNDDCFPISLESGHGLGPCIPFRRSIRVMVDSCDLTYSEQGNSLTSWVDASQVYGSSASKAAELRDKTSAAQFGREHGRLATRTNPVSNKCPEQLLPKLTSCTRADHSCDFVAGDVRVNEQPGLASIHTLFVRLHNVLEERMHRYNRHFNGETLFQETRRLVIALWQRIVYNEYLRVILGETIFRQFMLADDQGGYDNTLNPNINNAFSTAAFRFGHSEIPDHMPYMDYIYQILENKNLDDGFFNTADLYRKPVPGVPGIDSLMMGMTNASGENFDSYLSDTIREHLFNGGNNQPGMDLFALNIQRGRDHGIPGYGHWLQECGLSVDDSHLRPNVAPALLNLYGSGTADIDTINNIDLFAGGISETPLADGFVGPTFACIIGQQFKEIKLGDRFFYNHPAAGFTADQIATIESYTLASVLCDALDIESVQEWAMLKPWDGLLTASDDPGLASIYGGMTNQRKPCSEIPKLNFTAFIQQ